MSRKTERNQPTKEPFKVPSWAGFAPTGTHLNVMKGEKLVEKLIIDEKKCYFFGRNSDSCDFITEHASCSRVHAALLYHKHLKRMFVVDLGSMHGSFIRKLRLEGNKPTPVPFDADFHFGASTRHYILKERPQVPAQEGKAEDEGVFDLPKEEDELDNLTEFNTAHNKRVTVLPIQEPMKFPKRKLKSVDFAERNEVINPEDIDSSVGRFRNMVSVEVIPNKRHRGESTGLVSSSAPNEMKKHLQEFYNQGLYEDLEKDKSKESDDKMSGRINTFIPNLAPEVSDQPIKMETAPVVAAVAATVEATATITAADQLAASFKPKKKYTKEAWPGKRPVGPALLV